MLINTLFKLTLLKSNEDENYKLRKLDYKLDSDEFPVDLDDQLKEIMRICNYDHSINQHKLSNDKLNKDQLNKESDVNSTNEKINKSKSDRIIHKLNLLKNKLKSIFNKRGKYSLNKRKKSKRIKLLNYRTIQE
ncbi:hypothetical protein TUBRATIS_30010 [Tubulinosema ratisbonensis]|uniref:Uncharacterized protein n=1 Tax=Tubulinosema ratisbonensis TaxID=291195 RepID=A0A437AHE7_9MICR|nr:hypothetical protein TUBRATIS_30010 [Tubulinosema ratisbonensis]